MLAEIVKSGSHQQIKDALEKGTSVNSDELTEALLAAIQREDSKLVKLVLDHGADPNHVVKECWGALHIAVEYELFDVIRLLVEHGADVNLRNHSGSTPLHIAVDLEGDSAWQTDTTPTTTLTELLLQLGADCTFRENLSYPNSQAPNFRRSIWPSPQPREQWQRRDSSSGDHTQPCERTGVASRISTRTGLDALALVIRRSQCFVEDSRSVKLGDLRFSRKVQSSGLGHIIDPAHA